MASDTRDRSDFINAVNWSADRSHIKYIETYCFDGVSKFIEIKITLIVNA